MLSNTDNRWKVSHTDGLALDIKVMGPRRLELHVTYRMVPDNDLLPEEIAREWNQAGREADMTFQDFRFYLEESDKVRYNPSGQETSVSSVAPKAKDHIEVSQGALVFHFYGAVEGDTNLTAESIEYAKNQILREHYARIV